MKLVLDATRGISQEAVDAAVGDMLDQGATIINSTELLAMECGLNSGATSSTATALLAALTTVLGCSHCFL
jgi:hypothetical protein